jgi:hypothetical protein
LFVKKNRSVGFFQHPISAQKIAKKIATQEKKNCHSRLWLHNCKAWRFSSISKLWAKLLATNAVSALFSIFLASYKSKMKK